MFLSNRTIQGSTRCTTLSNTRFAANAMLPQLEKYVKYVVWIYFAPNKTGDYLIFYKLKLKPEENTLYLSYFLGGKK